MTSPPAAGPAVSGLLMLCLAGLTGAATAGVESLDLLQDEAVIERHRGLVGNIRALAKRDGVVRDLPQLFVYHSDHSPAYHLAGHRRGFTRELELTVESYRSARTMIDLDRLLERTHTPDGEVLEPADLPEADVTLLVYRRPDCSACETVRSDLEEWVADHPDRSVLWIRVLLDG